ncbi:LOW QUALITY PROTEIN: uncharacterized protein LOC124949438 [Vespa velutina]|uniref:LOW QUALITY PROTEIN: uncharacterized protein LOC124949438 n=1 Tax=Vespa velutina TaxID=202808 RepID=UPI001FB212C6|nr:LOW QUALITY PROTEIN: uncharacterized protein LOC124949438 [Vespa velutina]
MNKSKRYNKILNKIVNINEDYSEETFEEDQYELDQSEYENESSKFIESGEIKLSLVSEEENFLKVCRNKKRMSIFSSSDSEDEDERTSIPSTSQNVMSEIEIAVDGTQWIKLKASGSGDRTPIRMILKDIAGSTAYVKRNIMLDCVTSVFKLIIDRHIMEHIKDCTEMETYRVLKKNWIITVTELRSFLEILYAEDAYDARLTFG